MGLIKSGLDALSSTIADQFKEYFVCDALENDVLVARGYKKTSGLFSGNKGNDNVITNGSGVVVADGQCMIIVDDGKVAEVCAEPGVFTYDASSEPTIFAAADFASGIKKSLETLGRRFTYGGEAGKDQRVYYFNTKEIMENKFGTSTPVPFRVVDSKIGLDVDVQIRCAGVYSFRIFDPVLFYTNVCGNVNSVYTVDDIDTQMKSEFISALQPALAKLSTMELRPSQIIAHNVELEGALNEALTSKWEETRGIKVATVALSTVSLKEEDQEMITNAQKAAMLKDTTMAAATLAQAQADAMRSAANNPNGAMAGFYGMNMAQQAGGMNASALYNMNNNAQAPKGDTWTCACGAVNTGKFCTTCGLPKPEAGWKCECGTVNTGKFCSSCGAKKPE